MIAEVFRHDDLDPIFTIAKEVGWSLETTLLVIEQFKREFWRDPISFGELLEVLE